MVQLAKVDMTFILGAKCCDGVVLVGDTKITIEEGTRFTYGRKLFKPLRSVVMGASGISGFYSSFQNRMIVHVREEEGNQPLSLNNHERLKSLAENVIREMHALYDQDRYLLINNFNVLMALRVFDVAELVNFTGYGIPEPVNSIKVIGHGEPHGALFVNKMWNPRMTMMQTAKMALFIIKLIQDTKIDSSVGYNTDFLPQVYCLPDVRFPSDFMVSNPIKEEERKIVDDIYAKHPIQELGSDAVNRFLNEVGSKVSDFEALFESGQFRI